MKQRTLLILVSTIGLLVLAGCSQPSLESMILTAIERECESYINEANHQFKGHVFSRKYERVQATIDSLTNVMINYSIDTVYMVESCNRPLYSYHAYIWNGSKQYYFGGNGIVEEGFIAEHDKPLVSLIERWDIREIRSKSNSKPSAHDDYIDRTNFATRMIFEKGKCIKVETIYFREIDFESTANVRIFD